MKLFFAAEALAVAIWLIPASIHIVEWPDNRPPVRLALLAPTWQLLVAGAIAAAFAAAMRGKAPRLRAVCGPVLVLWTWAVPYLPWIPDRLPLLLVLAGPLRWFIAGAVLVRLFAMMGMLGWTGRVMSLSRRAVLAISLVFYIGYGLYSAASIAPGGDEPHYMIITESLLRDGDLQIENNHRRRDYQSFWGGDLRPDFFERGKNGQIYSIHAPGLPALILPVYAVAGRLGAVALITFLAALAALAVFDLAAAVTNHSTAVLTWIACCLTVPFLPYAWLIFPELPGTLLVAWGALWFWQPGDRSTVTWFLRGAALSVMPWLHTKFVVFLAVFATAIAWRLLRHPRRLAAFAVPVGVSGLLWFYSFYAIYGVFNPQAPYGDYANFWVLWRNIPHGVIGMFLDQKFGLLLNAPIYFVVVVGAWTILRRPDTRWLGVVLIAAMAVFLGGAARLYMFWGGSSAPARFLMPVVPCLAPFVAASLAQAHGRVLRALSGLALAASLAIAVIGVSQPDRLRLFSDPHGYSRLLEWLESASPLSLVVPTFTEPTWSSEVPLLFAWGLVVVVAVAAVVAVARATRATTWGLAGTMCAALLLGGAVISASPSAEVREATTRRGDFEVMWRFDGTRFRTLDYQRLGRLNGQELLNAMSARFVPRASEIGPNGYVTPSFALPPGVYTVGVWYKDDRSRTGIVRLETAPSTVLGENSVESSVPKGRLTSFSVDLPLAVNRATVRIPDREVAAAAAMVSISPISVFPPSERRNIPVRRTDVVAGRPDAYLFYTDEHAYPEEGYFWSRGTAETRVFIAPRTASRVSLTLSTGPMSGDVTVSVGDQQSVVTMRAGEIQTVMFDVPVNTRLLPITVQSSVMFRPGEVDKTSTDMRGLGCQVRVAVE